MQNKVFRLLAGLFFAFAILPLAGCPGTTGPSQTPNPDGGDNTNGNTDGGNDNTDGGNDNTDGGNDNTDGGDNGNGNGGDTTASLTPVKTSVPMHVDKRIEAGDDLVVFGTGGFSGVDYIVPSAGDTAGRGIPDGDSFVASAFAVAGKKIALDSSFLVTIYDTENDTSSAIGENVIRRTNTPGGLYAMGHMVADGNFIALRSDNSTDDGRFVKLIDVSGDTPNVMSFDNNPSDSAGGVEHVMVDAETMTVAAVVDDSFFIFDINDTSAAPTEIAIPDGIGDGLPHMDRGFIIFEDNQAFGNTCLVEVDTGAITVFSSNPSAKETAISNGSLGFFVDIDSDDSLGVNQRSAIGTTAGAPAATLAAVRDFIDGSTTNNGAFGYGETIAITADGDLWFIAGSRSVGSGEYLQVSSGGAFELLPDPTGEDFYGCPGADVSISHNTVAFKTGNNSDTVVGYIILP